MRADGRGWARRIAPLATFLIGTQSADEVIDKIMRHPTGTKLYLMAPLEIQVGEKYETLWDEIRAGGYPRMRVDRQTYSVDEPPTIDRRRKHTVEVLIDRIVVRAGFPLGGLPGSIETCLLAMGKGMLHIAYPADDVPEQKWRNEIHSQHFACDRCGRSFEPLTPHSFSFNSSLGWCPTCEGLGVQSGANPAALIHDPKLTLAEGAVGIWPNVELPMFAAMLAALSAKLGVPTDVPFEHFSARQRRTILHGSGDEWIDVAKPGVKGSTCEFRLPIQGIVPGPRRSGPLVGGRLPRQAGASHRRSGMFDLRRQPPAR